MMQRTDQLSREAVAAMMAVMNGTPAADAWLEYVREVHPRAVDALARMAISQMAVDLLYEQGDLTVSESDHERREVARAARDQVSPEVWSEISELRATLDVLERQLADPDLFLAVDVREAATR